MAFVVAQGTVGMAQRRAERADEERRWGLWLLRRSVRKPVQPPPKANSFAGFMTLLEDTLAEDVARKGKAGRTAQRSKRR